MDLLVFRWINGMAGYSPLFDSVMLGMAGWFGAGGPLLMACLWFLPGSGRHERRVLAVLVALAVAIALGIGNLPAFVYPRPRPSEVHQVTLLLDQAPPFPSFPSTHMAVPSAMSATLGRWLGRWRLLAWALVAGSMFARVFVGVHYPTDVLGGVLIGWTAGSVIYHNRDVLWAFGERVVAFGEELL